MFPSWIAEQYGRDKGCEDAATFALRAGVELLLGPCTGIDPAVSWVKTGDGQVFDYDLMPFDTGRISCSQAILVTP